jgi:hypothetical protein
LRLSPPVQARLNLTAAQKTKIDAISDKARDNARAAFGGGGGPGGPGGSPGRPGGSPGGGGDRSAAMAKVQAANAKAETEALKVLNPAQKKQFDALKAEAATYAGLGRNGNALLAITDLKPDQKNKLKTLATQSGAKREKLFSGASSAADGRAVFEKMQKLDDENRASVKKILTAPQQKKFDAAVEAGRGRGGPGGPGGTGGPGGGRPGGGGSGRPGGGRA